MVFHFDPHPFSYKNVNIFQFTVNPHEILWQPPLMVFYHHEGIQSGEFSMFFIQKWWFHGISWGWLSSINGKILKKISLDTISLLISSWYIQNWAILMDFPSKKSLHLLILRGLFASCEVFKIAGGSSQQLANHPIHKVYLPSASLFIRKLWKIDKD